MAREEEKEFAAYVVDLLQTIGPCYAKGMFGGFGIFLEGLMFALVADNVLYLKVDDDNRADFLELGLQAFSYEKQGKSMNLSYFQAPEEAMESGDVMQLWGSSAYSAAMRAAASKGGTRKKKAKVKK